MTENIDKDYLCGDFGEVTEWLQIKVTVKTERLDELVALMSLIETNLLIEDLSDIDLKTCYGDLIDEKILNADKTHASVSYFVPKDANIADDMAFLRDRLASGGFEEAKTEIIGLCEEDWANSWKEFYKPFKIGRIVIVPAWENYEARDGEIIVTMDPGMAFGTGTHETTRLVILLMQEEELSGKRVLDVGTGSGILSICASKLGAKTCNAYDIDPVAVKVASDNAESDGCTNITVGVSDLLRDVDISEGKYDVCVANIVSDIIIRMMPDLKNYVKEGAPVILSGIINSRADEVRECVLGEGYEIVRELYENDWVSMLVRRGA